MRCKPAVGLDTKELLENDCRAKVIKVFKMRQLLLIIYGCVLLLVSFSDDLQRAKSYGFTLGHYYFSASCAIIVAKIAVEYAIHVY